MAIPAPPRTDDPRERDEWFLEIYNALLSVSSTSSTGPSFSVHRNGANQNITNGTLTKVAWTTEIFDTNNDFDNVTNYRFTPTVAGKYLLAGQINLIDTVDLVCKVYLYKNGAQITESSAVLGPPFSKVVDANGTTDYFEVYAYHALGAPLSTKPLDGSASRSFFSGSRIS